MDRNAEAVERGQSREKLAELSREVIETRNQMIKTANVVSNLAAEVRDIGRQNQRVERGRTINSIGTCVVLVLIVAVAFYFTYRARLERVTFEKDVLTRKQAVAQGQLRDLRRAQQKRREAEKRAEAFYRLVVDRKVHRAIAEYPSIARLPLSEVEAAVFRDWIERNRSRLAFQAHAAGMRLIGDSKWQHAVTEFQRSLSLVPQPPYAAPLHYYLGVAMMKLGNYPEAAEAMETAVSLDAERVASREVRYHLGAIYEQLGRRDRARAAYREYIKRYPATPYARAARRRIKQLD